LGLPASGMCVFNETCGLGPALEHNGDLYACDHFVEPDYLLGNIKDEHMIALMSSDQQLKFGQDKLDKLPQYCLECDVRFACHGECPKNRFCEAPRNPEGGVGTETPDGEDGLNYLCAGFKHFFHHIDYPAKLMAGLIRRGRQADEVMDILAQGDAEWQKAFARTGRNESCPCGSGRKFKQCHGQPGAEPAKRPPLRPAPHSGKRLSLEVQ
jgi:uncharacterized protein